MAAPWYKHGVMYAVDVRMVQDANAAGIGELSGLTMGLDDLAELGITCIWLLPCFPTPVRDNG